MVFVSHTIFAIRSDIVVKIGFSYDGSDYIWRIIVYILCYVNTLSIKVEVIVIHNELTNVIILNFFISTGIGINIYNSGRILSITFWFVFRFILCFTNNPIYNNRFSI